MVCYSLSLSSSPAQDIDRKFSSHDLNSTLLSTSRSLNQTHNGPHPSPLPPPLLYILRPPTSIRDGTKHTQQLLTQYQTSRPVPQHHKSLVKLPLCPMQPAMSLRLILLLCTKVGIYSFPFQPTLPIFIPLHCWNTDISTNINPSQPLPPQDNKSFIAWGGRDEGGMAWKEG